MGYQTCRETFDGQTDVVAFLPGTEMGTVTVGGHYDSRPFVGSAPGAVDNGSGASAVGRPRTEKKAQTLTKTCKRTKIYTHIYTLK